MPRLAFLLLMLAGALAAGDAGELTITVAETITGSEGQGGDPAELGRIEAIESERIRRARSELPRLPPALARIVRQDIGTASAELERVVVSRGGTVAIGERTFRIAGTRIVADDGSRRLEIDLAGGTASSDQGGETQTWRITPVANRLGVADGRPGKPILGRATLQFAFTVDGKDHRVLVDPTLPNPYVAWRQEGGEADPLVPELARLPGFPLLVEQAGGRVTLRLTAVEIR